MNEAITHLCAGLYFQMPIILKASPASYYFGQMDVIFWVHTDPGPFWTLKDRKGLCVQVATPPVSGVGLFSN